MSQRNKRSQALVLLAVDDAMNRELMRSMLDLCTYGVDEAKDGYDAIEKAKAMQPDVILLDVMMPGLDGFEVCRRLKADKDTAPIPILMVTRLSEREPRARGIEFGAADLITEPIDWQDMALRIRNAVHMKHLYDQVQSALAQIRGLAVLREQLIDFAVHDMRAPLMAIVVGLKMMSRRVRLNDLDQCILDMAVGSAEELNEATGLMLDVAQLESGQLPVHLEECDVAAVAVRAAEGIAPLAAAGGVEVRVQQASVWATVDRALIDRVFRNLLHNAVKFSRAEGVVEVKFSRRGGTLRTEVSDTGPGIVPEHRSRISEKFVGAERRDEERKYSTEMGWAFCKLAVERHGGRIGLEGEVGEGSTFWFELPASTRSW